MDTTVLTDNVTLHAFPSRPEMAAALSRDLTARIKKDIETRNQASLALSGGTPPLDLFPVLKNADLDWEKVWLTLADERWLPPSDPESNEKMVRDLLLKPEAQFVGLFNKADNPFDGEAEAHRNLLTVPRPFTSVVLGMGDDGHTASLFPHNAALTKALDKNNVRLVTAVGDSPKPPSDRITLSLTALLDTPHIALHLYGEAKRGIVMQALAEGPVEMLPIRAILRQTKVPVEIYWAA